MARKRHTAEEIVTRLRQVDVLTAQGRPVADAIRSIRVTEVTYSRWRNGYGGLKGDQVKRLKQLETENARLRRAVSDLTYYDVIRCPLENAGQSGSTPARIPRARSDQSSGIVFNAALTSSMTRSSDHLSIGPSGASAFLGTTSLSATRSPVSDVVE